MNFAELSFWEHLGVGLAIILSLRFVFLRIFPGKVEFYDKTALVVLGLALLLMVSVVAFVIYIALSVVTYVGLKWIQSRHPRHATKYLLVLVPMQLLPLFYYKYSDFVVNRVAGLDIETLRNLAIPIGISFHSFQLVGLAVDTLVFRHPIPSFLDSLIFGSYFPQLVAGPIERRADLLPQVERFRFRWRPRDIDEGATWIAVGLFFKCCLADNLAEYFHRGLANNAYQVWMANVLFGLRIYYDFAGYSLVALGLSRCFGIRLTLNFRSPYCSTDIGEFWRRWHITLSQWFRDYVYVPLGGGRVRFWALNILVVFIISGIWHGAGWNFVWWGVLHAVFLIIVRCSGKFVLPRPLAWALTMVAAFGAWLCFYELDTSVMLSKMAILLRPAAYSLSELKATMALYSPGDKIVLAGLGLLTLLTLGIEWLSVRRTDQPYAYLCKRPVVVVLVILTVLLAPGKNNGFIYFAF